MAECDACPCVFYTALHSATLNPDMEAIMLSKDLMERGWQLPNCEPSVQWLRNKIRHLSAQIFTPWTHLPQAAGILAEFSENATIESIEQQAFSGIALLTIVARVPVLRTDLGVFPDVMLALLYNCMMRIADAISRGPVEIMCIKQTYSFASSLANSLTMFGNPSSDTDACHGPHMEQFGTVDTMERLTFLLDFVDRCCPQFSNLSTRYSSTVLPWLSSIKAKSQLMGKSTSFAFVLLEAALRASRTRKNLAKEYATLNVGECVDPSHLHLFARLWSLLLAFTVEGYLDRAPADDGTVRCSDSLVPIITVALCPGDLDDVLHFLGAKGIVQVAHTLSARAAPVRCATLSKEVLRGIVCAVKVELERQKNLRERAQDAQGARAMRLSLAQLANAFGNND